MNYQRMVGNELRNWRPKIFARDHYKCRCCGSSYKLECSHITDTYDYVDRYGYKGIRWSFRWDNLVTLCHDCHSPYHRSKRGFNVSNEQFLRIREVNKLFTELDQKRKERNPEYWGKFGG